MSLPPEARSIPWHSHASRFVAIALAATMVVAVLPARSSAQAGRCCATGCVDFVPATAPHATFVPPQGAAPASAKDFAVINDQDVYHVFYIKHIRSLPITDVACDGACNLTADNEVVFGHAISSDLEHWTNQVDIFTGTRAPTDADHDHVWAPSIARAPNNQFVMYYTGVLNGVESIVSATSSDLYSWTRITTPILRPADLNPALWKQTTHLRDPYLVRNPQNAAEYLLYFTATPKDSTDQTQVGLATKSSTALTNTAVAWTQLGRIDESWHHPAGNEKAESPHLTWHTFGASTKFYLWFSGDNGEYYLNGGNPKALSGWNGATLFHDFYWFASEGLSDGTGDYLAYANAHDGSTDFPPFSGKCRDLNTIDFRQIVWDQPSPGFSTRAPNPVRTVDWAGAGADGQVLIDETGIDLTLGVEDAGGRTAELEVIRRYPSGVEQVIPPSMIGLPASLALTNGQVVYTWTAQSSDPSQSPMRYKVRVKNQPSRPQNEWWLEVWPPSGGGGHCCFEDQPHLRAPKGEGEALPTRLALVNETRPAGDGYWIHAAMPVGGTARLDVYDVTGRHVRMIANRAFVAGRSLHVWDGRDERGVTVGSGIYFARLLTSGGAATTRIHVGR